TAVRRPYSTSPRSTCSVGGTVGSEYTVQDRPVGAVSSPPSLSAKSSGWSSGYSNSGTRPTAVPSAAAPPTITASPTAIASCWNWVPAGSPRTSPGTGSATRIGGAPPGGPAAARTVCSSDTAAASCRSGQGRPVRPAATASYAVTEWLGAHTLSAS